jgi:hypothetical protein
MMTGRLGEHTLADWTASSSHHLPGTRNDNNPVGNMIKEEWSTFGDVEEMG